MHNELMLSVSGARGILGWGMNPEVAARFTAAFGRIIDGGTVVVGRDSRPSGPILADAVFSALRFQGIDVVDLGLAATPTVEIMVPELGASGGIIITASHNGPEWNALKFLGSSGEFLGVDEIAELKRLALGEGQVFLEPGRYGALSTHSGADGIHIGKILDLERIDADVISRAAFTAVIDCVNGAGSRIVPLLLGRLGVSVEELHTDPASPFPHDPEPRPANLVELAETVKSRRANIGFACDPDADRLVLVDSGGNVCSEELTLAVAAEYVLRGERGPVAVNLSTTRIIDELGRRHGVPVHRSMVGEANVIAVMKEKGAVVGGEGNGGVIYPAIHYGRDAMVGIALVLQALAEEGISLREMVSDFPGYVMVKQKYPFDGDWEAVENDLRKHFRGNMNGIDGIRIDMAEGWIHVRRSNTEPVVRIITEAGTGEDASRMVEKAASILKMHDK